jgi:hypothetical protein
MSFETTKTGFIATRIISLTYIPSYIQIMWIGMSDFLGTHSKAPVDLCDIRK